MTGLTYAMIQKWTPEILEMVHSLMAKMWQAKHIPEHWKWKWLIPIPKKENPAVQDLRPIMLIEVLRKTWTGLIVSTIHNTILKHGSLHPAQHGFQPEHGTDTANIQVLNALEEAKQRRIPLYGSSWDMTRAFDSVSKGVIRLAWTRLGVPEEITDWLIALDSDSKTVLRSAHAMLLWDKGGHNGIPTTDTFHPEYGTGQGDVSSPQTWVAIFDILLCALGRVDSDFLLAATNGRRYPAPKVAYADDLLSFTGTLSPQNQSNHDLIRRPNSRSLNSDGEATTFP
jgi:hypothetical protein